MLDLESSSMWRMGKNAVPAGFPTGNLKKICELIKILRNHHIPSYDGKMGKKIPIIWLQISVDGIRRENFY